MPKSGSVGRTQDSLLGRLNWSTIEDIAGNVGTPFWIYLPGALRDAFDRMQSGASSWGDVRIAYSLKTNPFTKLLSDLRELGSSIEVVSGWEWTIASQSGFESKRVVFNGPFKTIEDMRRVVAEPPLTVNIDSVSELTLLEKHAEGAKDEVHVGLRLVPPRVKSHLSRFGIEYSSGEAKAALERIRKNPNLSLRTVHIHLGSQITEFNHYAAAVRFAREIWDELEISRVTSLDIGGGFPFDHDRSLDEQQFDAAIFFRDLAQVWGDRPRPGLIVEPGRVIAAPSFALVSRVLSVKKRSGEPDVVVLDSGTNHNVMAAFFPHLFAFQDAEGQGPFRLCGPLCMEDDILSGALERPSPREGSLVATFNAGAYSLSLMRSFIQARPPIVEILSANSWRVLLERESSTAAPYSISSRLDADHLAATSFPSLIHGG